VWPVSLRGWESRDEDGSASTTRLLPANVWPDGVGVGHEVTELDCVLTSE